MKKLYDQLYVAGQLTADDFEHIAAAGIKTIINNRPDNEAAEQLGHEPAAKLAAALGMAYHYLPMQNGVPLPPILVEDFRRILNNADAPVLAHCRSGMRSSFIWALGQIAQGNVTVEQAITAASEAGIPLNNVRAILESAGD